MAGGLLEAAERLLNKGIHPSIVSQGFLLAQAQAVKILRDIAVPIKLSDRDSLIKAATTSLNSKVVSTHSSTLAPLAVDAVMKILDLNNPNLTNVNLEDIKIVKKLGGTVDETALVDGLVFTNSASKSAGGPTSIKDAKIGLIQYCLSAPKTNVSCALVLTVFRLFVCVP